MISLNRKQVLLQSNMDLVFVVTIFMLSIYITIILISQLSLATLPHVKGQTFDPSTTSQPLFSNNAIISTRGHFSYSTSDILVPNHNVTDYEYQSTMSGNNEILCPQTTWTDDQAANEQFNRTAISLINNNYTNPLIGFSWDSNTPINRGGWETAKNIAEKNGPKLAQFVLDFKNKCKDMDIRLIAHSLGAEVINSTLESLNSNWNERSGLSFTSVHLLGAAIDRSSVGANTAFGKAIEKLVGDFYNIRDSEDNMLQYVYRHVEKGDALGLLGISHSKPIPKNYFEREINSEIPPIQDVDGNGKLDCFDFFVILPGDIGARGLPPFDDIPRNNGAIDVVVLDWLDKS